MLSFTPSESVILTAYPLTRRASMIGNDFGLRFHHFGLAVKDPALATAYLTGLGYRCGGAVYDPLQNVRLVMGEHDQMPAVEVIYPAETKGPLDSILVKRPEGIVYHLCYESVDLRASLSAFQKAGLRVIEVSPPKPALLFGGQMVSFYLVAGIGLIEIIGT